ncbi:Low-specificity L-threonine aldolase [Spathaspora sp. JA1]|nr:Low-specificity L-threonine aldolase [Spathaspora sp. JA1]
MDFSNFSAQSPAHNEFRSDTFTTPTLSMIQSLGKATLGDAVYNEDQATVALEEKVAAMTGKESGLFCVSGTLSNQIAMRVHLLQPPYSVLCDHRAHVYVHEAAGLSTLSQAMPQPIAPKNGIHLTLEDDILPNFIPDDGEIHGAPTKLICLENTLHGMLFPLDEIKKISAFCKANDVKLHLDGARLWNAHVETGISLEEYWTVLVGNKKFILKANHFKKQNGGGIRQSGLLATMATVAIDENLPKLKRTHDQAKELGKLCEEHGIILEHPVQTNFVFIDILANKINPDKLIEISDKYNVKIYSGRVAFHYQVSDESFENAKKVVLEVIQYARENPFEGDSNFKFYTSENKYHVDIANHMTLKEELDELGIKTGFNETGESNIVLFTTRISCNLIEFLQDDFNFELSLRLVGNLKEQLKIRSIKDQRLRFKQLIASLFTRIVLNYCQGTDLLSNVKFTYNEYGKPQLNDQEFQFSSSSSNDIISIVVEYSSKKTPIGIDLSHSIQSAISAKDCVDEFSQIFESSELLYLRNISDEFNEEEYRYRGLNKSSAIEEYKLFWFDSIDVNPLELIAKKDKFIQSLDDQSEFFCLKFCK